MAVSPEPAQGACRVAGGLPPRRVRTFAAARCIFAAARCMHAPSPGRARGRWRAQAAERGAKRLRVHCLTDGRDVEDGTSVAYMERLQRDLGALREATGADAAVASGGGRMRVTMDRYEARARLDARASAFGPAPPRGWLTRRVPAAERLEDCGARLARARSGRGPGAVYGPGGRRAQAAGAHARGRRAAPRAAPAPAAPRAAGRPQTEAAARRCRRLTAPGPCRSPKRPAASRSRTSGWRRLSSRTRPASRWGLCRCAAAAAGAEQTRQETLRRRARSCRCACLPGHAATSTPGERCGASARAQDG